MTKEQEIILLAELETAATSCDGHVTNGSIDALLEEVRRWMEVAVQEKSKTELKAAEPNTGYFGDGHVSMSFEDVWRIL
jgi:hypothetical protein